MLSMLELCHPLTSRELVSLSQAATSLENLLANLPGPFPEDCEGFLQLAFRPESNTPPLLPNLQKLHFFLKGGGYRAGTLTDDRIKGLTQIAETRCEIEEPRNCQHPPLRKVRWLQDFRIIFRSVRECLAGQEALEAKRPYSLSLRSLQRLYFLEDWLGSLNLNIDIFRVINFRDLPLTRKNRRKRLWFPCFGGIERMCDVEDVAELYVRDGYRFAVPIGIYRQWQESGIHHFMYDIYHSLNMDSHIWISDDQHRKAKLILDKLTPMLLNDVRNRKWSYQGIQSICYVSNDHGMVLSPPRSDVCWTDTHLFSRDLGSARGWSSEADDLWTSLLG